MPIPLRPPAAALQAMFRRRLDRTVTIQAPVVTNGIQQYQDWRVGVRAAINPMSGVEAASGAIVPTNVGAFMVYIEFIPGVLLSYQLAFEGRFFSIVSAINLAEADLFLQLVCKESQV